MNINQIAILLELIGFVLASLFIAALKIEKIKSIADKQKKSIVHRAEQATKGMLVNEIVKVIRFLLFIAVYLEIKKVVSQKREGNISLGKSILDITKQIFIQLPYAIVIFVFSLFIDVIERSLSSLADKMSPHNAITNLMIILGSLLVFIGLIIEFIASYLVP